MPAETSTSFVQIPSELLTDPKISALDLRIYVICMDFGFKGRGYSQIGHQHLGRLVGKHPKTIAKSIKNLTNQGYIVVDHIGQGRNDRIRCQKTVRRSAEKQKSDGTPTIPQGSKPTIPASIRDRSTKKRYKAKTYNRASNPQATTDPKPSEALPDPLRSSIEIEAIHKHQPRTDHLSDRLNMALRPASVACWFKDMAVIDEDDTSTTISVGRNQVDWIQEHYSKLLDKTAGKKVNIVI